MPSNSLRVTVTLVLAALLGCRNSTEPGPVVTWLSPAGCNGTIDVTVSSGVVPTISWTPYCGISSLSVTTVPAAVGTMETMVWGFSVPERHPLGPGIPAGWGFSVPEHHPLGSGIRYGRAPTGATVWTPAQPLHAGTTYRVRVMLTIGLDVAVASGARTFVP